MMRSRWTLGAGLAWMLAGLLLAAFTSDNQTDIVIDTRTISATGDIPTTKGTTFPVGGVREGMCILQTTAVSGTTPTLDLYIQTTNGTVDDDYCRFLQVGAAGSQVLRFSTRQAVTTLAAVAASDRAAGITAGNCRAGSPGDRLKFAGVIAGTATPTVTIKLTCNWGRD